MDSLARMRREEPQSDRPVFVCGASFFGETDGSERAARAQAFVGRYRWSIDGRSQLARALDRGPNFGPQGIIDRNPNRDAVRVVADPSFGDLALVGFLNQEGVSANLQSVGSPSLTMARRSGGTASLVFVGQEPAVAASKDVDRAMNSQLPAFEGLFLRGIVAFFELDVHTAAGVDRRVSDADALDLFEIEKSLAIDKRVQRTDTDERLIHWRE